MPIEQHTLVVSTKVKGDLGKAMQKIRMEGEGAAKASDRLSASTKKLSPAPLNNMANAAKKANRGLLNMLKSATLMGYNLQGLVLLAVNKLRSSFVDLSDQYNRVIGQMEKYSGSSAKATELTHKLQEVAVTTGWDLDSLSSTFTKLGTGLEQFGQTEEDLIEITQGLGLKFRQMGDDGKRLPKVAGQLVTLFTSATFQFSKFDALLGRGRAEQLFGDIAKEMGKIPGVDLEGAAKRGESAMSVLQKAFKEGTIDAHQISSAFIRVAKSGNLLDPTASEIGHGWDRLSQAVITLLTRFDKFSGFSNTLAKAFSWLSEKVLELANHLPTVMFYFEQIKKIGIGVLIAGAALKLGFLIGKVLLLAKAIKSIPALIGLINKALKASAFGLIFTGLVAGAIAFSAELDKLAQKIPKSFGWMRDIILFATKGLKSAKEGVTNLFDDQALENYLNKLKEANKITPPTPKPAGGDTAGTGATGGGTPTPQPVAAAALDRLREQIKNVNVAAKNNWITEAQRAEKLKQVNTQARDVIATNAKWLVSNKKTLADLQGLVRTTDKFNVTISPAAHAFETLNKQMENINAAARSQSITEDERVKKIQALRSSYEQLLTLHGKELESNDKLRESIEKTLETIGEGVTTVNNQAKEVGLTLGQQALQATQGVGGKAGGFASSVAQGAMTGGAHGALIAGASNIIVNVAKGIINVDEDEEAAIAADRDEEAAGTAAIKRFEDQIKNLEVAYQGPHKLIDRERYLQDRAAINQAIREWAIANADNKYVRGGIVGAGFFSGEGGTFETPILDLIAKTDGAVKELEKIRSLEEQAVSLEQQQLEQLQQTNEELTRRLQAAELEAEARRQLATTAIQTHDATRFTELAPQREQPQVAFKIINVDDPEAVSAQLASEEGERVFMNTLRRNDGEISEYVTR